MTATISGSTAAAGAGGGTGGGRRRRRGLVLLLAAGQPAFQILFYVQFGSPCLQRDVAVLLGRIGVALGGQHLQGLDQAQARAGRLDHVVDVALPGGAVGIGEQVAVQVLQFVLFLRQASPRPFSAPRCR